MFSETMVAQNYTHTSIVTAGNLKSYQLLLERAILMVQVARQGNLQARNRAQNIVVHIQNGMNLELASACQLFEVMGHIWDALERNQRPFYDRAEDLLRQMRDLVISVQRRVRR